VLIISLRIREPSPWTVSLGNFQSIYGLLLFNRIKFIQSVQSESSSLIDHNWFHPNDDPILSVSSGRFHIAQWTVSMAICSPFSVQRIASLRHWFSKLNSWMLQRSCGSPIDPIIDLIQSYWFHPMICPTEFVVATFQLGVDVARLFSAFVFIRRLKCPGWIAFGLLDRVLAYVRVLIIAFGSPQYDCSPELLAYFLVLIISFGSSLYDRCI